MSKLDSLLQSALVKAEPLLSKALSSGSQDGERTAEGNGGADFGALLQNLTEQKGDGAGQGGTMPKGDASLRAALAEILQNSDAESDADEHSTLQESLDATAKAPQALILEQVIAQVGQALNPAAGGAPTLPETPKDPDKSPERSLSDLIQPLLGEDGQPDVAKSMATAPMLNASVVHQETHFKPVLRETTVTLAQQPAQETAVEVAAELPPDPAGKMKPEPTRTASEVLSSEDFAIADMPKPASGARAGAHADNEVLRPVREKGAQTEQTVRQPLQQDSPASLPAPMLQKIAGAVLSEARSMASAAEASARTSPSSPGSFSIKASDGVVRVMSIQMHPVELGLVTVKMRLSGDRLEMELQTTSEETARLLRSDTDKLSGLLRASGYQPDVITVQSVASDGAQQNSPNGQRPQSANTSQQFENLQQGFSNSEGRDRKHSENFKKDELGGRHVDANETVLPANRSTGGVYL